MHVRAGFGMEADQAGAGLGEIRDDPVDRLDHQVHVDRCRHPVLAQRLADQRADGQVGYVVVVHDVEVDPVGAGLEDVVDLLAQSGEVGRQDGRGDDGGLDAARGHGAHLLRRALMRS
jgi:hypothetical protein